VIASQDGTNEPRPAGPGEPPRAGPVGAGDPPPPPVAKASSGAVPPTPPPAGGGAAKDGGGGGTSPDEVQRDLKELLADAEQKKDEYLELAKRTQADFENYRKRMAAEVQAASSRGRAELAGQVIGVIDTLEKALEAAGVESADGPAPKEPLAEGFFLTYRELCEALRRSGVESFDPSGEAFDPNRHEALQKVAVDGAAAGTVVEVMQKGYALGELLIRPARVVVAE
jgi:molecular chaperone GrpE